MKKISLILALIIVMSCVLTACGKNYKAVPIDPDYVSVRAENPNQTINGIDGIKVSVPKTVNSIVCFSPEAAVILRELGAKDKIKGVDKATTAVLVGANEITLDKIQTLSPDVVFVSESYDATALMNAEIPCFTVPTQMTINDIKSLIKIAEKIMGSTNESLSVKIDNEITLAQQTTNLISNKAATFVDLGEFKTSGNGTYINEIINISGGKNVFADKEGFVKVTNADIIAANPEYIFTVDPNAYKDEIFEDVAAVKNNRVYRIDKVKATYGTHNIADVISTMFDKINNQTGKK